MRSAGLASSRIGTITYDWYPFHARVRALAEAAADAGYCVDVICPRQPHESRCEVYNGVHVYRLPIHRRYDRSLPGTILSWCWFLLLAGLVVSWLHVKRPYQVIHVHNMPDFLIFAATLPKLLCAKLILDVQDASPELMADKARGGLRRLVTRLATWQERLSTIFADQVVTVGWTVEEVLLQRGVPREKLISIFNSANPAYFPPARRAPPPSASAGDNRPFILMYHGTVTERQGLDIAIRALALARQVAPEIRLHIKGSKEQLPALEGLAAQSGVLDQIVLSDICPIGEVADFVLQGDVGIIPYRAGGYMELVLPVKAFEFAWMRRPMIASDLRGIRSLFRPESLVLCDPTPESFAEAIIDLYQHPEKRERLVANAAEDYEPYRWEMMAKRYQQVLAALSNP
ncbi:MAG TPA: glycosyltransferase family 4 protein [Ktedonobacterales bacterium]|jgi:glycosyltransferase involved in cell wall biosynthesis